MNLTTDYLGLKLRNPFVVGASPMGDTFQVARELQDAGAAAIVRLWVGVTYAGSRGMNSWEACAERNLNAPRRRHSDSRRTRRFARLSTTF